MRKGQAFRTACFVICLFLSYIAVAQASTLVRQLDFADPVITAKDDMSVVSIEGLTIVGNPGEPMLPAYGLQVLLPQGEDVVNHSSAAPREREIPVAQPVEWGQPQSPLSMVGPRPYAAPDGSVYLSDRPFPSERVVYVTTETFRGYNIAFFRVYPVAYIGSRGMLVYTPRLDITVETAPSPSMMGRSFGTLRRGVSKDVSEVGRMVGDVSAVSTYTATDGPAPMLSALVDAEETYPYVIITHSDFVTTFEPVRLHREACGLRAKIVTVGQINGSYSGADLQDKIRNFIKDAYLYWETEYVLLGGDTAIIPDRGFYADAGGTTDDDIASDLYYGALDGNWNDDGDGLWGEPDEADLIPEVCVGRASVGTETEANNFINKLLKYENSPVVGQIKNAEMVGELLWEDPTWGADSKDEIKDGSSAHGYTTVGFPGSFTVNTLYDRDIDPDRWDKEDLIPILNGGTHIVNHLGHSDVTYGLRMYDGDVETRFTNDGVSNTYFIIYTQGCYSGSFDNRTVGGGYIGDCLGEHFIYVEDAAVAFIGNTRYGWGAHMSTRGANQYYDRQFFDALFGEGLTQIGKANDDSKVDNIPYIDLGPNRWVYYELVLLGDPAMDIWTDTPGYVTLDGPDVFYVGDNEVALTVTDGTGPVEGARVSIFSDSTYSYGYTDAGGEVFIDPIAIEPGSLQVAVWAHNLYALLDTVPVVTPSHAVVIIDSFTIDDDGLGGSSGDSNGKVDAGETIESVISLRNVGQDTAFSVSAEIETTDPFVAVIDSAGSYGDIPSSSTITPGWAYRYGVLASTPDSHVITFDLDVAHSDTVLTKHFSTMVSAPVLSVVDVSLSDTLYGNGDGCIEAGEAFELVLTLANGGSGDGLGVSVILSEADPYASIDQDSAYVAMIASGGEGQPLPPFVVDLEADCPEFHTIAFDLTVLFESGRQSFDSTTIYVGGSLEEYCENGEAGWVNGSISAGYDDEWHLEDYRNHTSGGTYSWKFGGADDGRYTDYGHGGLVTPELCLGPNASLTFWHWIHAELQSGSYAWDGAIVEISTDGGDTWSQITPVGGYSHMIYPNGDSPFDPDTPCFAWTDVWTEVEFDLTAYEGRARLRFAFGSDGYVGDEGWYVDDIVVTDDYASVEVDNRDLEVMPTCFALHGTTPNPVASFGTIAFDVPRTSRVTIAVFDVTGRLVDTLADSVFEPGRYSRSTGLGKRLVSGVYFVRMNAESFSATQKLIVLK